MRAMDDNRLGLSGPTIGHGCWPSGPRPGKIRVTYRTLESVENTFHGRHQNQTFDGIDDVAAATVKFAQRN